MARETHSTCPRARNAWDPPTLRRLYTRGGVPRIWVPIGWRCDACSAVWPDSEHPGRGEPTGMLLEVEP